MKRNYIIFFINLISVCLLFSAGCHNNFSVEIPDNISIYQLQSSAPGIPYANDLQPEQDIQIPESLLTLDKTEELFAPLGFKNYTQVSKEGYAVSIYRAESGQDILELEADKNRIVNALTLSSPGIDNAAGIFTKFVSLIILRDLTENEKDNLIQNLQLVCSASQETSPDVSLTINSAAFVFSYDQKNDRFYISY